MGTARIEPRSPASELNALPTMLACKCSEDVMKWLLRITTGQPIDYPQLYNPILYIYTYINSIIEIIYIN